MTTTAGLSGSLTNLREGLAEGAHLLGDMKSGGTTTTVTAAGGDNNANLSDAAASATREMALVETGEGSMP